jgi:HD-like signal output (HDOD) protein
MNLAPPVEAYIANVAAKLPVAHRLLVELGQLLRDPYVESDEIVQLLRQDPSLVAQLIRMANSAAFAPAEPVGSLERALACIGFTEVHRLVGVVAAQQFSEYRMRFYPVDGKRLRKNALFVALTMEELAKPAKENERSCYTVGLLRTVGMMALEVMASPDARMPTFAQSGHTELCEWERQSWGTTNCEVAEKILIHWRLPHETVAAIRYHYDPAHRHNPIIHLLKLAAGAAEDRFFGVPGESAYFTPDANNFVKAGLEPLEFQRACERAQVKFERLSQLGG